MRNKGTKLWLSKEELELLENTQFFEAKHKLIEHLIEILTAVREFYRTSLQSYSRLLPSKALSGPGKISKGENYLGLPYLILDFPAIFEKDGVFAFRTMYWWGHPVSITFHISGKFLQQIPDSFLMNTPKDVLKDLYVGINKDQWVHHHESSNYIPFYDFQKMDVTLKKHSELNGFLKVVCLIENEFTEQLPEKGEVFIKTILDNIE